MKTIYSTLIAAILVLAGCSTPERTATAPPPKTTKIEGLGNYALAEPISHGGVTLIPVVLTTVSDKQDPEYTTLTEAKKAGTVEISELNGNQEVSRLLVKNIGDKPLMLLGGELLLGGKQDRVVAKDTIIPPHDEAQVPVFCVEHGRWSDKYEKFSSAESAVPQSVRNKATYGKQQDVWDGVALFNGSVDVDQGVTSVRAGLLKPEVQAKIGAGMESLRDALNANKQVVGVVCLVNGKIVTMELFGSNSLFRAHQDSLLKGFLADGVVQTSDTSRPADMSEISKFVSDALVGQRQQRTYASSGSEWEVSGRATRGTEMMKASEGESTATTIDNDIIHGTYAPKDGGR